MNRKTRLRFLVLALGLVLLLSSCSGGAMKLTYENGAYRNSKNDAAFLIAPICYRAASQMNQEIVAKISGKNTADVELYAIENMDRAEWLTDKNYAVYYSERVELPSLRQMQPNRITLCKTGAYTFALGYIENRAEVDDIVDIYEKGTTVPAGKIIPSPESRCELLFSSSAYPGLAYSLEYWKFSEDVDVYAPLTPSGEIPNLYPGISAEIVNGEAVFHLGKALIYDRSEDRVYSIGTLLDSYFTAG